MHALLRRSQEGEGLGRGAENTSTPFVDGRAGAGMAGNTTNHAQMDIDVMTKDYHLYTTCIRSPWELREPSGRRWTRNVYGDGMRLGGQKIIEPTE